MTYTEKDVRYLVGVCVMVSTLLALGVANTSAASEEMDRALRPFRLEPYTQVALDALREAMDVDNSWTTGQ